MSYNRGHYLLNCIKSIQDNFRFDFDVLIFDDHSSDPETIKIIKSIRVEFPVFQTQFDGASKKHKGLYLNMNLGLKKAIEGDYDLLFIIQDDTQVIRTVDNYELDKIGKIFNNGSVVVVVPLFFKMNHQKNYQRLLSYNANLEYYYPVDDRQNYLQGVSDVGIFDVRRLKEINWFFLDNEADNIALGRKLGLKRAVLKNPFLAYLPWPKTYRNKITNFNDRLTFITDRIFHAGFHPFEYISPEALNRLFLRSENQIPFAEDYLVLKSGKTLKKPWNYYESSFPIRKLITNLRNKLK